MNPIYQKIKEAVTLEQALTFYGCSTGRHGMTNCPFHGEDKHPSMNIRNGFFYCHTCGAHGDVIGFVAQYFGLSPSGAAVKLDNDFRLGVAGKPVSRIERSRMQAKREAELRELEHFREVHHKKTMIRRYLWWAYMNCAPASHGGLIDDRYVEAVKMLPVLDSWFDQNPYR